MQVIHATHPTAGDDHATLLAVDVTAGTRLVVDRNYGPEERWIVREAEVIEEAEIVALTLVRLAGGGPLGEVVSYVATDTELVLADSYFLG